MTLIDARTELKRIAAGRYHRISIDVSTHCDGEGIIACRMYVDGPGWADSCPTYEAALFSMSELIRKADNPSVETEMLDGIPRALEDETA